MLCVVLGEGGGRNLVLVLVTIVQIRSGISVVLIATLPTDNPPIEEVIQLGCLPQFVKFLECTALPFLQVRGDTHRH